MRLLSETHLKVLKNRNFLILSIITFLFQATTAFVLLSLIVSAFLKTDSNFAVSGVVLSFVSPAFLLTAISGLAADLFDRRKILIVSNFILSILVIMMIIAVQNVYILLALSFLYFAVNSIFLPTASAISAQVASRKDLLITNSIFLFTLAVGQLFGFFVSAIVQFFAGPVWNLVVCAFLSLILVWLSYFLPPLNPRLDKKTTSMKVIGEVTGAFIYIFKQRSIRLFFVIFALTQAAIAFGVTLAPGFFDDVVGISINKSPMLALPMVAIGVYLGISYVHNPEIRESYFVAQGLGIIGISGVILGLLLRFGLIYGLSLIFLVSIFLIVLGFGIIVSMVASRTVLQKRVNHNFQGSVFAATIILGALFASVASPLGAQMEKLFGYVNVIIFIGLVLAAFSTFLFYSGEKANF